MINDQATVKMGMVFMIKRPTPHAIEMWARDNNINESLPAHILKRLYVIDAATAGLRDSVAALVQLEVTKILLENQA